jgi:hypothetical protein
MTVRRKRKPAVRETPHKGTRCFRGSRRRDPRRVRLDPDSWVETLTAGSRLSLSSAAPGRWYRAVGGTGGPAHPFAGGFGRVHLVRRAVPEVPQDVQGRGGQRTGTAPRARSIPVRVPEVLRARYTAGRTRGGDPDNDRMGGPGNGGQWHEWRRPRRDDLNRQPVQCRPVLEPLLLLQPPVCGPFRLVPVFPARWTTP